MEGKRDEEKQRKKKKLCLKEQPVACVIKATSDPNRISLVYQGPPGPLFYFTYFLAEQSAEMEL